MFMMRKSVVYHYKCDVYYVKQLYAHCLLLDKIFETQYEQNLGVCKEPSYYWLFDMFRFDLNIKIFIVNTIKPIHNH